MSPGLDPANTARPVPAKGPNTEYGGALRPGERRFLSPVWLTTALAAFAVTWPTALDHEAALLAGIPALGLEGRRISLQIRQLTASVS